MTQNEKVIEKEQGIVTIFLPPLSAGDLFEIHAAIKTVLGGLPAYKMDFRILGQKGEGIADGGLGNTLRDLNQPTGSP